MEQTSWSYIVIVALSFATLQDLRAQGTRVVCRDELNVGSLLAERGISPFFHKMVEEI